MPVTLTLADHPARDWRSGKATSATAFVYSTCQPGSGIKILQGSLYDDDLRGKCICPYSNGLVWSAIRAYSDHHHLVLRPEDVWFAILSQFSFYVNAHAEELRDYFVSHDGQKPLEVSENGTINTVDIGLLARRMADLIQDNVKQPRLRDWIMPSFSTTTPSDCAVAAVLMMGAMQTYFSYKMALCCGIPSVQLLGERKDWEDMLARLDYLSELGAEPDMFARLLKPVLRNFVASFDSPPSASIKEFWGKIAHETDMGSGPTYLSGWITAFCFWNAEGQMLYNGKMPDENGELHNNAVSRGWWEDDCIPGCVLEGLKYHFIETDDIPPGFASVPVVLDDNGEKHDTTMLAGSIGLEARRSGNPADEFNGQDAGQPGKQDSGLNTVQPVSGWFMYEASQST